MTPLNSQEYKLDRSSENVQKQPAPSKNYLSNTSQFKVDCVKEVIRTLGEILQKESDGLRKLLDGVRPIDINKEMKNNLSIQMPPPQTYEVLCSPADKALFVSELNLPLYLSSIELNAKNKGLDLNGFKLYAFPTENWVPFKTIMERMMVAAKLPGASPSEKVTRIRNDLIVPLMKKVDAQSKNDSMVCQSIFDAIKHLIENAQKYGISPLVQKIIAFNGIMASQTHEKVELPQQCKLVGAVVYEVVSKKYSDIISPKFNSQVSEADWKWSNEEVAALKKLRIKELI